MSQRRHKHYLFAESDSPLQQVLESIKDDPASCFKDKVEDAFLLLEYPYVLKRQRASPKQVVRQAEESIRRLNQKITALTALITSMPEVSETQPDSPTEEASSTMPLEATDETDDEFKHLCASEYF